MSQAPAKTRSGGMKRNDLVNRVPPYTKVMYSGSE